MKIRTRITLLVTALIAVVVGSIFANIIWVEKFMARADAFGRTDVILNGVARVARESVSSNDELMLLSYLKFMMKEYPEIELAMISEPNHSSVLGNIHSELFYKAVTINSRATASYRPEARTEAARSSAAAARRAAPPPSRSSSASRRPPLTSSCAEPNWPSWRGS